MQHPLINRRSVLQASLGTLAGAALLGPKSIIAQAQAQQASPVNAGRIYKAVKIGMVQEGSSLREKFQLLLDLGFDGVEMNSPGGYDKAEARALSEELGLPIHGLVDSVHWQQRLSHPNENTRRAGVDGLLTAIHDAHAVGASSVLLVPGRVTGEQETHDHVWQRSIPLIQEVLPVASRLGIHILIENVWNGFCYDPEQLAAYIDEINSPWMGVYFDIGNHRRWGTSEEAIRVLGSRIVKLDVKGWGQAEGFGHAIGDGDVNWPAVVDALGEIGYSGWATAEVGGGNRQWLADVAARMDEHLQIG